MPTVIRRDGEFLMTDKDLYKIEQAQPLLGRIRRLLPSEELYSDRRFTTVLSTIFGFGSFTNGERQQEGELLSREFAQRDAITKENQIQSALNPTP